MLRPFCRYVALLGLCTAWSASGAPATTAPAREVEPAARLATLRKLVLGTDPAASDAAIRELRAMGTATRDDLRSIVGQLLAQDRAAIEAGVTSTGDLSRFQALEQQVATLRAQAIANIAKLGHDETVPAAHKFYSDLQPLNEKLNAALAVRDPLARAMGRRARLQSLLREPAVVRSPFPVLDSVEAELLATAQAALDLTPAQAGAIPELGQRDRGEEGGNAGDAPSVPLVHDLWWYRASRRIDAYNDALRAVLSPGEWQNFREVNKYRECLGLLPYELDLRLAACARAHSREMVELKYFAHESPVPANKTHVQRMRNAGYDAGFGENIAFGVDSGAQAFWMWFDSPGHHRNMAARGPTALGVGVSETYWTQDTVRGPRLMLMSAVERKKILDAINAAPAR